MPLNIFLPKAANPTRPVPRRINEDGSGTGLMEFPPGALGPIREPETIKGLSLLSPPDTLPDAPPGAKLLKRVNVLDSPSIAASVDSDQPGSELSHTEPHTHSNPSPSKSM